MSSRGGRLGNSRLKPYTYTVRYCRACDSPVELSQMNTHFRISHPKIYYNEYPGRRRMMMREETA